MAIALRGTATTGTTTITAPTGVASGDLLIVVAIAPSATTITVPSGWTTLRNVTTSNTSTLRMVIAYQVYSSGSTWSITGATYNVCSAYSGCDGTTPILTDAAPAAGGNVSTLATPTVNNTASGAWRVACWGAAETQFSSMGAWSTFSPTDTRRGEQHNTQYSCALTDSNATISTGNTSITGTTPASQTGFEAELAWIGIIQPVQATPVSASDTATGADTASVTAAATETGSGAESATLTASIPASETGSGADSAVVAVLLTGTDSGTGTDSAGNVLVVATDVGAGLDSAATTATVPGSETGVGAESGSRLGAATDTGGSADSAGARIQATDTGVGGDSATVTVLVVVSDAGLWAESMQRDAPVADSASWVDNATRGVSGVPIVGPRVLSVKREIRVAAVPSEERVFKVPALA
jgi:hypothetical protein